MLNARIRKRWRAAEPFPIALLGERAELTYDYDYLGNDPRKLDALAAGDHPFAGVLREAARPMLILGMGALVRPDGPAILDCARRIAERTGMIAGDRWNGFNVLHTAAARVGGLDLGFVPGGGGRDLNGILDGAEAGEIDFVYLLGADELDTSRLGRAFVVYQGHHGDEGAHRADVILPGAAYTEKDGTYVNLEGRAQGAWSACKPPGEAKEDWAILRALSEALGRTLPVNTLADVRRLLADASPVFAAPDAITRSEWQGFGTTGSITERPFAVPITNFYLTNAVCRASVTMAQCVEAFTGDALMKTGTHG